MWPGDGMSVGVGQPIRVQFTNYVPKEYRAAVEKACPVTTSPAVAGAWYWVQDDMMDWRPQHYWQPGTQVSVALNLLLNGTEEAHVPASVVRTAGRA